MEEEKGIKDNVEEVKENLQAGPSLTAGAEPREEGSMVLRTEDLVKKYGKRTVVSHVSIDVKQGEIVGLLGPNGAGKTTSFYMTVGLITPNEGRIFLKSWSRRLQNYIAMVFPLCCKCCTLKMMYIQVQSYISKLCYILYVIRSAVRFLLL